MMATVEVETGLHNTEKVDSLNGVVSGGLFYGTFYRVFVHAFLVIGILMAHL